MRVKIPPLVTLFLLNGLLFWACKSDDAEVVVPVPTKEIEITISTFGGSLNESGESLVATNDGGYAVLGFAQSNDGDISDKPDTDFDFWLLKFDGANNLEWTKTYGGSDNDRGGGKLIATSDGGGFALFGFSQSSDGDLTGNGGGSLDYWVLKTDATGEVLWQRAFGFKGRDEGISIIETQDKGFLLVGGVLDVTASEGQGNVSARNHAGGDYWVVKLDSEGVLEWSQYFGGTFTDTAFDAVETKEGDFLIVGSSDSFDVDISNNLGTYDFWVLRISSVGELIWEKNYGGSEIDEAKAIATTPEGNYMIIGDTRSADINVSFNNGAADVWVIKIDGNGELLWEKTFGGSGFDGMNGAFIGEDGALLIAGNSRSEDGDVTENKGQNDVWILKVNDNGTLLWQKTIGGSQVDLANGVVALSSGQIIVVGETASSDGDIEQNKGFADLLILKMDIP